MNEMRKLIEAVKPLFENSAEWWSQGPPETTRDRYWDSFHDDPDVVEQAVNNIFDEHWHEVMEYVIDDPSDDVTSYALRILQFNRIRGSSRTTPQNAKTINQLEDAFHKAVMAESWFEDLLEREIESLFDDQMQESEDIAEDNTSGDVMLTDDSGKLRPVQIRGILGVDSSDYPDFVDAYFDAVWADTGGELSPNEEERLNDENASLRLEMAYESMI